MAENVTMNLLENTPKIQEFAALCEKNNAIERELYTKGSVT